MPQAFWYTTCLNPASIRKFAVFPAWPATRQSAACRESVGGQTRGRMRVGVPKQPTQRLRLTSGWGPDMERPHVIGAKRPSMRLASPAPTLR